MTQDERHAPVLIPVSGSSEGDLRARARALSAEVAAASTERWAGIGAEIPSEGPYRAAVIADRRAIAIETLDRIARGVPSPHSFFGRARDAKLAFVYPGQGSQYVGMARVLRDHFAVFRASFDRLASTCERALGQPIQKIIFEPGDAAALRQTHVTQPALVVVELALTELWRSWGVVPSAVLGHSVGEIAAASAAGAISIDDALLLSIERGRAIQALPGGGAMLSLHAGEAEAAELCANEALTVVSAINGERATVVSGPRTSLDRIARRAEERQIRATPLDVSHAFHSPLVAPAAESIRAWAARLEAKTPRIPLVSNVTGDVLRGSPDPEYWARHLAEPVRFADGVRALAKLDIDVVLEIGPHATLSALGEEILPAASWIPSLLRGADDRRMILEAQARLWVRGVFEGVRALERNEARVPSVEIIETALPAPHPIAVIGMHGRFPDANDLDAFWSNLASGRCAIKEVPESRWPRDSFHTDDPEDHARSYARWAALLDDLYAFDPEFFGFSQPEATVLHPAQRLFLETAYGALERAGYGAESEARRDTGVFVGGRMPTEALEYLATAAKKDRGSISPMVERMAALGRHPNFLATWLSDRLNLRGPSFVVDAACASSHVAVHLARQSLLARECRMAIAGGVDLVLDREMFVLFGRIQVLSPSGQLRPFHRDANGYVMGEGTGALVLKRLDDALADRDHVHALILESRLNNDGRTMGVTTPNIDAQRANLEMIYRPGGLDPRTISYFEAHGTGTTIGDPIEVKAISQVFRKHTPDHGFAAIGSVKSNIGHLHAAAGIAGLIKIILAMEARTIPASLGCEPTNPRFDFSSSALRTAKETTPWALDARHGSRRRAAINGFGLGGTNAHLVVEEAPPERERPRLEHAPPELLAISARTPEALRSALDAYDRFLETTEFALRDIAATSQLGRAHHRHRIAVVGRSLEAWRRALEPILHAESSAPSTPPTPDEVRAAEERMLDVEGDALRHLAALYGRGASIDWARIQGASDFRRVPLPLTPLDRIECRFVAETTRARHPLIDRVSTDASGETHFEKTMTAELPFLADHRIYGTSVWPGVSWIEVLRAASELGGRGALTRVSSIRYPSPLRVQPGQRVTVRGTIAPNGRFRIASDDVHAEGEVGFDAPTWPSWVVEARGQPTSAPHATIAGDALYRRLRALGYGHGPVFQNVLELQPIDGRSQVARIERTDRPAELTGLELDPALMDSATLATFGPAILEALEADGDLFLPLSIEQVIIGAQFPARALAQAQIHAWTQEAGRVSILVTDEHHNPCVVLDQLAFKRAPLRSFGDRRTAPRRRTLPLHRLAWAQEPARPKEGPLDDASTGRAWLLIGPSGHPSLAAIAGDLGREGSTVRVMHLDSRTGPSTETLRSEIRGGEFYGVVMACDPAGDSEEDDPVRTPEIALQVAAGLAGAGSDPRELWILSLRSSASAEAARAVAKVAAIEHPRWRVGTLEFEPAHTPEPEWSTHFRAERADPRRRRAIAISNGTRHIRAFAPSTSERSFSIPDRPVCVVTGGTGGLGIRISEWLFERWRARLVLIARRPPNPDSAKRVANLEARGAEIAVESADVAHRPALTDILARARSRFGRIDVVFHTAGSTDDGLLSGLDIARAHAVMSPKIHGTRLLDELTRDDRLSAFVCFTSASGLLGNLGQASYAAANAYADASIRARAARSDRSGKSLAIAWGPWREAGMARSTGAIDALRALGLESIETEEALEALEAALGGDEPVVLAAHAIAEKLDLARPDVLLEHSRPRMPTQPRAVRVDRVAATRWMAEVLAEPRIEHEPTSSFLELGFTSRDLVESTRRIEDTLGAKLYPTLFFEYPTPEALADHLLAEFSANLAGVLSPKDSTPPSEAPKQAPHIEPEVAQIHEARSTLRPSVLEDSGDVAIIGFAGRFPGANDVAGYWARLIEGAPLISEIPPERWDYRPIYDRSDKSSARSVSKWGAFLSDVECFDSDFFDLSPTEARSLDPQQRIFIEVAWQTLDDAGYGGAKTRGTRTGVWVGYGHDHYYQERLRAGGDPSLGISLETTLANRLSYFMDWRGPSMVINTLCSASLVAIHLAAQSIRFKECDLALVGGVHAALSPEYYVAMSSLGALSPTGRSRAFDASADGYTPGEAVGAVLLKPLARAIADGDQVHGVIKGSAVAQAGRASSFQAPSIEAQAEVIQEALARGGLSSEDLDYIEAHAVGTKLGDAIELRALSRAFLAARSRGAAARRDVPCYVGSNKPLFGHAESAAGMAGLQKILLALAHERLPATLDIPDESALLDLDPTQLALLRAHRAWPRDARRPRRAGISAFSLFGSYAHLVIEEPPLPIARPRSESEARARLLAVSARSETELASAASRLSRCVDDEALEIRDICFTQNTGRAELPVRMAVVARDRSELLEGLRSGGTARAFAFHRVNPLWFSFEGEVDRAAIAALIREDAVFEERFRDALEPLRRFLPRLPSDGALCESRDPVHERAARFAGALALASTWRAYGIEPDLITASGVGAGAVAAALFRNTCSSEDAAGWIRDPRTAVAAMFADEMPRTGVGRPAAIICFGRLAIDSTALVLPAIGPKGARGVRDGLLESVGRYWCAGGHVLWDEVHRREACRRVSLPPQSFSGNRYWVARAETLAPKPEPRASQPRAPSALPAPATIEGTLMSLLGVEEKRSAEIREESFLALGFDSIGLSEAAQRMSAHFGVALNAVTLFEHPSIAKLTAHLASLPIRAAAEIGSKPRKNTRVPRLLAVAKSIAARLETLEREAERTEPRC
jgi:polyketide synthase PksN